MNKRTRQVLIWGASGHAKVVADIIRRRNEYRIIAFIDNVNKKNERVFLDAPVLTTLDEVRAKYEKGIHSLIIAVGDCSGRSNLAVKAKRMGFDLINAIHPQAIVAENVLMGQGVVVAAGVILGPDAHIGDCAIINTGATVDHDCHVLEGVHIGPGVHIGGGTIIGRKTWVGIGAVVVDHVRIGKNSVIGAGSIVTKNIPDNVIAYGCPAKIIRKIKVRTFD